MEVTTDRCIIRDFKVSDLDQFIEYRNDLSWMKYQHFKGRTKEEYERMIITEHPDLADGVQLAIVHHITGALLGDLYLKMEKRVCWVGYTISPKYARQGYAYEAVQGMKSWIESKGAWSIKASVEPHNVASIHLLEKMKFREVGVNEEDELVFEFQL